MTTFQTKTFSQLPQIDPRYAKQMLVAQADGTDGRANIEDICHKDVTININIPYAKDIPFDETNNAIGDNVQDAIDHLASNPYQLSAMTPENLGGAKLGDYLKIDENGVLSLDLDQKTTSDPQSQKILGKDSKGLLAWFDPVQGPPGKDGVGIAIKGDVATYADLPTSDNANGDAYIVRADGLLYIYAGQWPEDGKGHEFVGPPGKQGSPGVAGTTDWAGITNKPAVIAEGTDATTARKSIGAGTSDLSIGTTSTTAKAGDYVPSWAEITGKPAVIAAGSDAAAARAIIGAGTSNLAIGVTSTTAKAGDYEPDWTNIKNKPAVIASGATAEDARTSIGAGTGSSNLILGTTSTTAKAGDYAPTWAEVTGKPTVIAAGTDAISARAAIGAGTGTSDLVIGTTASTAKAGNYVPSWAEITGKPIVIAEGATAEDARTSIGAAPTDKASGTADGLMAKEDKTKLDGVANQATKNDTDANLRSRATHTGTQAATTVMVAQDTPLNLAAGDLQTTIEGIITRIIALEAK